MSPVRPAGPGPGQTRGPVSRYVEIAVGAIADLDAIADALGDLRVPHQRATADPLMLAGSLECPGQPVDIRLEAGTFGSVEDFGFVRGPQGVQLVCGELDRSRIQTRLMGPLEAAIARRRALQMAADSGLKAEERREADGTLRILLREES